MIPELENKRLYEKDSEAFRIFEANNILKLKKGKMGFIIIICGLVVSTLILGLVIINIFLPKTKDINKDIFELVKYYFTAIGILFAGMIGYYKGSSD